MPDCLDQLFSMAMLRTIALRQGSIPFGRLACASHRTFLWSAVRFNETSPMKGNDSRAGESVK
jgi:hypothetical protein